MATLNSLDLMSKINESLKSITDHMWVLVPAIDLNHPDFIQHYLKYIDKKKYLELSNQCPETIAFVSTMAGNVRGKLTAKYMEFNLSLFVNFFRKGWSFTDYWFKIKKAGKKISNKSINID
jgi:hypothetical protein